MSRMDMDNNFQTPFKQDQYLGFESPQGNSSMEKTPEKKSVLLKCVCSCSAIDVTKWEDEEEYYITFYESFNSNQSFFARIKNALIGKNNSNHGIVLSTEDFKKLKEL